MITPPSETEPRSLEIARHALQTLLRMPPGAIGLLFGRAEDCTLRIESLSPVTQITKSGENPSEPPIGFWMAAGASSPPSVPDELAARWPDARLRVLVDRSTDGRLDARAWLEPDRRPLEMEMREDAPLSAAHRES